jgi:hypothetical protein
MLRMTQSTEACVIESDKIVAAILTAAYAAKDAGAVDPRDYIRKYHEMLQEIRKHEEKVAGFAEKLEAPTVESKGPNSDASRS